MKFLNVTGKMGNMKKSVEWTLTPVSNGTPGIVIIQSDKRIARVNIETARAMLSTGKNGHNGFAHLSPALGAVEVDVPALMIEQLRQLVPQLPTGGVLVVG